MAQATDNTIHPETRDGWRAWLQRHGGRGEGVWVASWAAPGKQKLDREQTVEEAICFGWSDSNPRKLDDARTMLWFAPRKRGTPWAPQDKKRAERMIKAGRMTPAGLSVVETSKRDGSWSKLEGNDELIVPPDLARALQSARNADANFNAFPRASRRSILEWIASTKVPVIRARRIEETARLASQNLRANQWQPPKGSKGRAFRHKDE